ncbi:MAG: TIGR04255 family protein [Spirochaetaceae bacterium]|jgi:uncharacterized protein (TIGR04255 family)|nr:TIGR04255 family protein [Spirochaetaceae bacterium]
MFEDVKLPKKLANSPINEAVFEIRYAGKYPGEALYGVLFDVFKDISTQNAEILPILQIPQQVRDMDPNLYYQPFYRVRNNNLTLSVGPHSIVFSVLKPYAGWTQWTQFFYPIIDKIKEKNIITQVERIWLRTFDVLTGNIFERINVNLTVNGNIVTSSPSSFYTEFKQNNTHVLLNINNAAYMNGMQTRDSLIDITCIRDFYCDADRFFSLYKEDLENAHAVNKQVFFGLLKEELTNDYGPEY